MIADRQDTGLWLVRQYYEPLNKGISTPSDLNGSNCHFPHAEELWEM